MKRPALATLAVLAVVLPVFALAATPGVLPSETRTAVETLRDSAMKGTRAVDWARRLCDEVGPRLAGSAGDRAAVAWALALLPTLGFANVRKEPVRVQVWERGVETGEVVSPYPQRLVLTALGGSVATPDGGLAAPVVEVASLEALDELARTRPGTCKDSIVFINRRTFRSGAMDGYGQTASVRTQGAIHAAKAGAIGVLIRSIGTSSNRIPHTGAMRYEEGVAKVPAAALSNPDADLLSRLVALGKPVVVRFTLGCRQRPDAESANVLAEIPGREKPEEVVVLGGHLDSWDLGTGAIDDAAGCAIAIEAARRIGELPRRPRRTVRVVLFANEENGLAGGRGYPKAHAAEMEKHVAAIEADSGTGLVSGFGWSAGEAAEPVLSDVAKLLVPIGAGTLSPGGGGADTGPLLASGVPLLGLRQDTSTYFDFHHTANDTFDKIDPKALDQAVAALAAMAYAVADVPEPLPRVPPEKRDRKHP